MKFSHLLRNKSYRGASATEDIKVLFFQQGTSSCGLSHEGRANACPWENLIKT